MNRHNVHESPFDTETLIYFNELLLGKHREADKQVDILGHRIAELHEADDSDSSSVAHHIVDMGSNLEEEQMKRPIRNL